MKESNAQGNLWLSLATPPFFLGLTLLQSATKGLIELGQMSEEIFRGEQLPLLNFPDVSVNSPQED